MFVSHKAQIFKRIDFLCMIDVLIGGRITSSEINTNCKNGANYLGISNSVGQIKQILNNFF